MAVKTTEEKLSRAMLLLTIAVVAFFAGWMFFVEPELTRLFETLIGKRMFELPEVLAVAYLIVVGFAPPFAVAAGAYAFAYFKWFIPNRGRLAQEQLIRLADARQALASAVTHIEGIEQELRQKSAEAEKLRDDVLSLKLLNSENATELERKLKAMESLTRNRIWFERAFAFIIGILSSLVATYVWQVVQPSGSATTQSNRAVQTDAQLAARR